MCALCVFGLSNCNLLISVYQSLFSTTAFGLGAKYFAFYEEMGVGVQWDNINISPVEDDEYNLFMVTLMMILDCLIYAILVWYIEHVHPGEGRFCFFLCTSLTEWNPLGERSSG